MVRIFVFCNVVFYGAGGGVSQGHIYYIYHISIIFVFCNVVSCGAGMGWEGGQGQRSKEWPLLVAYQLGTGKYPLTKTNLVSASIPIPTW